jgi:hypothetical protein
MASKEKIAQTKIVFNMIHTSIALDRALASLTGFLTVRYIRCGVISPTIYLILAT